MASTQSKKRTRRATKPAQRSVSFDEARIKQLMKEAVREVLEERGELDQAGDAWDRQIEADMQAGRLDRLADQALADFAQGRSTEL